MRGERTRAPADVALLLALICVALPACEARQRAVPGSTVAAIRVKDDAPGAPVTPERAAIAARCTLPPPGVTLAGLLIDMVDLAHLTELAQPPYASGLASSHDPASDTAEPGSKAWFANRDFVALDRDAPVTLLEVEGPGVITRLWSARPAGVLRVYVDGAATPAIEADLEALLSGAVGPFTAPYAFVAASGYNLYFPIPFARGCRITLTGQADAVYYHVGYRRYAAGTDVQPYGAGALAQAACVREAVAARLSARGSADHAADLADAQRHAFELSTAHPERPLVIEAARGGSMIWQLSLRPARSDDAALRATVLTLAFDGLPTVRAPLGDFFARGPGAREARSLPVTAAPDGALAARWPMPFARQAVIALEPTGAGDNTAAIEVTSSPWPFTERSLYLHAQYRPPDTFASKPSFDWTLAAIEGRGHYVGNVLNVVNRNAAWWGEGDEKIYVDGEARPSHFGTGTEDYYGYAFCANERFASAYVGMPATSERQSFGRVSLHRFHVLDPIPFARSLRFDLEVRHWGEPVQVTYDALAFWYARPGARAPAHPPESYRVPEIAAPVPDVPAGPYRCGG